MKNSVLFLAVLLSACASFHRQGGATGSATVAVPVHRNAEPQPAAPQHAAPQPAARQRHVPVEVRQPARSDQGDLPPDNPPPTPPKKNKHNIEED
jgi:hypothetical protein